MKYKIITFTDLLSLISDAFCTRNKTKARHGKQRAEMRSNLPDTRGWTTTSGRGPAPAAKPGLVIAEGCERAFVASYYGALTSAKPEHYKQALAMKAAGTIGMDRVIRLIGYCGDMYRDTIALP